MDRANREDIFMTMVHLVALGSHDESTKVGAVIVGPDHEVRSTGFNGFPRGVNDHDPARQKRPEKYYWFEHAERNAIYNAARMGLSTKGCVMYTNGVPCADCARAVIQAGITKVVVNERWEGQKPEQWVESCQIARVMFEEAGVELASWAGTPLEIKGWKSGKEFLLHGAQEEDQV
jgi:dCMP deaminase